MANSSKKTKVRSIRASFEFWETLQAVAEKEKTDPNKLIIRVVNEYCEEKYGRNRD